MLKKIATAGLIAVVFSACSPPSALTDNNQPSEKPTLTLADVLPEMRPSSPEEVQQQELFVKESQEKFISSKVGAVYFVQQAKRTFNEQKTDSAAFLFGRAWLLDSTNHEVYWGYGLVYGQQKEYDKALVMLYHALGSDKSNPRLLTDIATSHLGRFYEESSPEDLLQSRKLLEEAISLSPDNSDAYYKLAINCYYLKEYRKAWEYLHTCLRQDKDLADKTFIAALLDKQYDPMGIYDHQNIQ